MLPSSPQRVERLRVPAGYPATQRTLRELGKLVRRDLEHPRLRERVRELFRNLASNDTAAEIRAVWDHILENVRYQRDPLGVEHLTAPVTMDAQVDEGTAGEDCESIVGYAAALLGAAGIPSLLEIQGRRPNRPDRFTHCSLQVLDPRQRTLTSFDIVAAQELGAELGDTVHVPGTPLERWTLDGHQVRMKMRANSRSPHERTLRSALLGDLGDAAETERGVRFGIDLAQEVAKKFGPWGELAAGLVQIGEDVYDAATGKKVGTALPAAPGIPGVPPAGPRTPPTQTPGMNVQRPPAAFLPRLDPRINPKLDLMNPLASPPAAAAAASSDSVKVAAGLGFGALILKALL